MVIRTKWHYRTLVRGALPSASPISMPALPCSRQLQVQNIINKIKPTKLLRCNILPPKRYFIHVLLRNLRVETCQGWSAGGSEHIRVWKNFGRQTLFVWGLFHNKFQVRITYPCDKASTVQTIWTCRLFWNLMVIVFSLKVGYIYLKEYRLVQYPLRALTSVGIHNYKEKGL